MDDERPIPSSPGPDAPAPPSESGWTVIKALGMTVAVLGMIGFGACSTFGAFAAIISLLEGDFQRDWLATVVTFLVPGVLLTAFFAWTAVTIKRSVGGK